MQHPDEGTIHAWLDGALPPDEGRAIEEHAAECPSCAAAIAEARGMIAGSSRILAALDAVPGGVLPSTETFTALGSDRAAALPRHQWWQSVPLRAAAAIVLVGSVSWMATRSGVHRDVSIAPEVVTASAEDRMAVGDTLVTVAPPPAAPSPKTVDGELGAMTASAKPGPVAAARRAPVPQDMPLRREAANVVAQSAPVGDVSGTLAGVARAGAALPKPSGSGARVGSSQIETSSDAEAGAHQSRREFAAKTATVERDTIAALRARNEARLLASPLAGAQPPMAAMSAAAPGALMPGSDALQRLLGCYSLELPPQSAADRAAHPSTSLLPARIELLGERADARAPAAMVARPAAGEPALPATARASWKTLGERALELKISDAGRSLTATLTIAGDSLSGWARASDEGREDSMSMVRGRRTACPAP